MIKNNIKELYDDKRIKDTIHNSINYGFNQICKYSIEADKPIKEIAESFVRNIFSFYKKSNSHPLAIEKEPVPELEKFWEEVSLIGCYNFGELERYVLATQGGIPTLFLTKLIREGESAGKTGLVSNFLDPIYQKIKKEEYDYQSLEEINTS